MIQQLGLWTAAFVFFSGELTLAAEEPNPDFFFEYELWRTAESPGFFLLQVFPNQTLAPIVVENVIVQPENEALSPELSATLSETGLKIISAPEARSRPRLGHERRIWIGEKEPPAAQDLSFLSLEPETAVAEWNHFMRWVLRPSWWKSVQLVGGGNFREIRPNKNWFVDEEGTYFVGKYTQPRATRVELIAQTSAGERSAVIFLDFLSASIPPATLDLAQIWQGLSTSKSFVPDSWFTRAHGGEVFPWLLFLLGVGCVLWGSYRVKRQKSIE